ncbi:MAG TPA: radical SAM protein [Bacteroidota bacterium]|nr:radical SAM protein [Bacteroidota bacterium]
MEIQDIHGRSFCTLRVSLTNACNFGCAYCVNGEDQGGVNRTEEPSPLPYHQLAKIVIRLHEVLHLSDVRLTGGEPTLYHELIPFLVALTSNGISNIKMTTNGFLLKQQSQNLFSAGVRHINVSLDAVEPEVFTAITKRQLLPQVLEGIEAALLAGMNVKLNAVVMRGVNEHQILPLLEYAMRNNIELRYLELMRMGHFYSKNFERYFFSMNEMNDAIKTTYTVNALERKPSATSQRWQLENGYTYGIIANESRPFCSDCNRLRLDSFGNIYGCLSDERRESILDCLRDETTLIERLQRALLHKQPVKFKGSPLKMIAIGG